MMCAPRLAIALVSLAGATVTAADWPHWRGPNGTGSTVETGLPVKWSATENIAWKAPVAGLGVSRADRQRHTRHRHVAAGLEHSAIGNHPRLVQGGDPAAAGERALGESRRDRTVTADGKTFFLVEAFRRADGKKLWEYRIEAAGPMPEVHDKHNMASPSPVSRRPDGLCMVRYRPDRRPRHEREGGLAATSREGDLAVRRRLGSQQLAGAVRGHAASPVRSHTASYLLALDKRTGKEKWKADRGKGRIVVQHAARGRRSDRAPR